MAQKIQPDTAFKEGDLIAYRTNDGCRVFTMILETRSHGCSGARTVLFKYLDILHHVFVSSLVQADAEVITKEELLNGANIRSALAQRNAEAAEAANKKLETIKARIRDLLQLVDQRLPS